jgi:riboflavin synthase
LFTGIIEEVGQVVYTKKLYDGLEITISARKVLEELATSDSVAVDGTCQTVVSLSNNTFSFQAVGETIHKTTLAQFNPNRKVNLERALTLNSRLGGHLIQGHINETAKILNVIQRGENYYMEIDLPPSLIRYCITEGSIAVDGISLTIAKLDQLKIGISIIPHTFQNTTLQYKKIGDPVNIEVDMIGKYVESLLLHQKTDITIDKIKNWGY